MKIVFHNVFVSSLYTFSTSQDFKSNFKRVLLLVEEQNQRLLYLFNRCYDLWIIQIRMKQLFVMFPQHYDKSNHSTGDVKTNIKFEFVSLVNLNTKYSSWTLFAFVKWRKISFIVIVKRLSSFHFQSRPLSSMTLISVRRA